MGKNMWKFNFLPGHRFAARDDYGRPYQAKWDKLNLGACIQQGDYGMRGDSGVRGYRDDEGHYGVTGADGMGRGYGATGWSSGGMSRYGADYDRGMTDRGDPDSDRGYRGRQQIDNGDPYGDRQNRTPIRVVEGNRGRYDQGFRGGRNWF
jgi:hypothetical protein